MSATAGAWRPQSGPVTYELASWGVRAAAYLIDMLVFVAVALVITLGAVVAESDLDEARDLAETLAYAIGVPLGIAYAPLLMVRRGERNGQTLGKQVMKIRVVRENGEPVTLGNGLLREVVGRQLPAGLTYGLYAVADYLWPLWDRSRQCLHDKVAKTRVVRLEPVSGAPELRFTTAPAQATVSVPEPVYEPAPPVPAPPVPPRDPVPARDPDPAPAPAPPRDDRPVRGDWLPPRADG